jgi:hypothetical protein
MFTVVATIFQQIMTKFNGAKSEEDRVMAITEFTGGKYGCSGENQQQL